MLRAVLNFNFTEESGNRRKRCVIKAEIIFKRGFPLIKFLLGYILPHIIINIDSVGDKPGLVGILIPVILESYLRVELRGIGNKVIQRPAA